MLGFSSLSLVPFFLILCYVEIYDTRLALQDSSTCWNQWDVQTSPYLLTELAAEIVHNKSG